MGFIDLPNSEIVDNTEGMHVLVSDGKDIKRAALKNENIVTDDTYEGLETEDKTVIGAINEINNKVSNNNNNTNDTELVNTQILMSNQEDFYICNYESAKGFEAGKTYKVIINDEEFLGSTSANGNIIELATGEGLDIKYNTASGMYVINYYPVDDIGSNPTVNFEVYEMLGGEEERQYNIISSDENGCYINDTFYECLIGSTSNTETWENLGPAFDLLTTEFLSKTFIKPFYTSEYLCSLTQFAGCDSTIYPHVGYMSNGEFHEITFEK